METCGRVVLGPGSVVSVGRTRGEAGQGVQWLVVLSQPNNYHKVSEAGTEPVLNFSSSGLNLRVGVPLFEVPLGVLGWL